MNTKYQSLQKQVSINETVIVQEKLQIVGAYEDFKKWWNSNAGSKFMETAKANGQTALKWGAIVLGIGMFTGLLYVIFERFRVKNGEKIAEAKLIDKLEHTKIKLNKDPRTKGKFDSKINQAINNIKSFKSLEQNKKIESVI